MTIYDIDNKTILNAILNIMTPEDIYWELPDEAKDDIKMEIEDQLHIELEDENEG